MKKLQMFYISLLEPISIVTEAFRDQAIAALITKTERNVDQSSMLYYDPSRYLKALLADIFYDQDPFYNFNRNLPSTRVLVQDGLRREIAVQVGLKTYIAVASLIRNFLPNQDFSNTRIYNYDIIDERDICISSKVLTERDSADEIAASIEQDFFERQQAFERNSTMVQLRANSFLITHELAQAEKIVKQREEEERNRVALNESERAFAAAAAQWDARVAEMERLRNEERNEIHSIDGPVGPGVRTV